MRLHFVEAAAATRSLQSAETHYSVTITGVPTGAFSKKLAAIRPGKRMQPWDAANGGT
jgi:hypothetical protein